jgi:2-polyprenyl-6-methoxyphenol hydroxylase-like FAD-dependent oxidoreductase
MTAKVVERCQVAIVGGGPVGLALAVELGRRGIFCTVIERHRELHRIPKGQNLSRRTLEHFYFWGIVDELRAARLLPPAYPIGGIVAYRDLTSEYWFAHLNHAVATEHYFQRNERLPQYLMEQVLRRRLLDFPNAAALFGWRAEQIEQDDRGVRVDMVEEGGSARQTVEAAYVVGCDGGRSMLREHLGIDRGGDDFDQRMVLAVFRSRELHEALKRFPERTTYRVMHPAAKGYWHFFGRVDVGEGWFFHAPVPKDTTPHNYDFHGFVQRVAGFPFAAEFDHVGFWDLRIQVASTYQRGRAFIAGDAAHTHPPYGGYGLNSGLEDITNLGWKLAARLQGWGGEGLLASYSQERQPIFAETGEAIADGIKRDGAFLARYSPERDRAEFEQAWKDWQTSMSSRQESYEPHYEGSAVVCGPPGAVCSIHGQYTFEAKPGHHLSPLPLASGRNVYEELGPDFTLIALDAAGRDERALADVAASLGVPLKLVRDRYDGERTAYGARLILVRPDQYVAWAGDQVPDDMRSVLCRVTGQT